MNKKEVLELKRDVYKRQGLVHTRNRVLFPHHRLLHTALPYRTPHQARGRILFSLPAVKVTCLSLIHI